MYHYFVSYSWGKGHGMIEMKMTQLISDYADINKIKRWIEANTEVHDVVILNYQFIKTVPATDTGKL